MKQTPRETIYARSIVRRAIKEISSSSDSIALFSPYITSPTIENLLEKAEPSSCEIYTTFQPHVFASGSSSIASIKNLMDTGFSIYHLPNLHAKVLVTEKFASIGSQNFTNGGRKNKEVTATFVNGEQLRYLNMELQKWLLERRRISMEMVDEIAAHLTELKREFNSFQKKCDLLASNIFAKEEARKKQKTISNKTEIVCTRKQGEVQGDQIVTSKDRSNTQIASKVQQALETNDVISSEVTFASVRTRSNYDEFGDISGRYSTLSRYDNFSSFLEWSMAGQNWKLEKRKRYLLILLDNGRLAWPALNKTQISQFGVELVRAADLGNPECRYELRFRLPATAEELGLGNFRVRITPKIGAWPMKRQYINMVGNFSIDQIDLRNWKLGKETDDAEARIAYLISRLNGGNDIQSALISHLFTPFYYERNSNGIDADTFFDMTGIDFELKLQDFKGHKFLTAKSCW